MTTSDFAGRFVLEGEGVGGPLALTMESGAAGELLGVLSGGTGTSYQLEGTIQEGVGVGVCSGATGTVFFELHPGADGLQLVLIEPDFLGQPDYTTARRLVLVRETTPAHSATPPGADEAALPTQSARLEPRPQGSATISDACWGFEVTLPPGWKHQHGAQGAILGHDEIAGMILVGPHHFGGLGELRGQMERGLSEAGVELMLTRPLVSLAPEVLAGDYRGTAQGAPVWARGIGTLSPHGGGAIVIALVSPELDRAALVRAAEALALGLRYVSPDTTQLPAGVWEATESDLSGSADAVYFASFTQTVTLFGDGTVGWQKQEGAASNYLTSEVREVYESFRSGRSTLSGSAGRWTADGRRVVIRWSLWDGLVSRGEVDPSGKTMTLSGMGTLSSGATLTFKRLSA